MQWSLFPLFFFFLFQADECDYVPRSTQNECCYCSSFVCTKLWCRQCQLETGGEPLITHRTLQFNAHNSIACLFFSRFGALKSLGVRIGKDKWGECYPQSGPNERSEGDAHILSAKGNKTIPPKACLNANWTVVQSRRHLFVSSFGQWFISIRHRIHTFGMLSMSCSMPLKINFINPLSVQSFLRQFVPSRTLSIWKDQLCGITIVYFTDSEVWPADLQEPCSWNILNCPLCHVKMDPSRNITKSYLTATLIEMMDKVGAGDDWRQLDLTHVM